MRLIDADALKQYCDENWIVLNHDALDEQPIVDAIPIEWLKSKCEEHKYNEIEWLYEAVIEDWKRENE